jgi:hypothetical protein
MPAFGRSLADFPKLSAAEELLLANCRRGLVTSLGEAVPLKPLVKVRIRAGLIRFLALGGDDDNPVHENGILLAGAWIDDVLDLDDCSCNMPFSLIDCRLAALLVRRARLGQLTLSGSQLTAGLAATGLQCRGDVYLDTKLQADAEVRLDDASIGGNLICSGAQFDNPNGYALSAERVKIAGALFLRDGFVANGCISLASAQLGGPLECSAARLTCADSEALLVDGATIRGSVFMRGIRAAGAVRLAGTTIEGNFECDGSQFDCAKSSALNLEGSRIKGSVFLRGGVESRGRINLSATEIGSNLECSGSRFTAGDATAVYAERLQVKGNMFFDAGFSATGGVALIGAAIDGNVYCDGGHFISEGRTALDLEDATIGQCWHWRGVSQVQGVLDIRQLHVGSLFDDPASWELSRGRIILDGFRYDRLARGAPTDAPTRIAWLKLQSPQELNAEFRPQPWEQCASVLKAMGHPNAARQLLVEKERVEHAAGRHGKPGSLRWWSYSVYGWLTAYGYWPINLLRTTVALYLFATLAFWIAARPGWQPGEGDYYIAPAGAPQASPDCLARADTADAARACRLIVPGYDGFFAPIHALENMVPVSTLRRGSEWKVRTQDDQGNLLIAGLALQGFSWLVSLWGWLASVLLLLWLGKLIRRD